MKWLQRLGKDVERYTLSGLPDCMERSFGGMVRLAELLLRSRIVEHLFISQDRIIEYHRYLEVCFSREVPSFDVFQWELVKPEGSPSKEIQQHFPTACDFDSSFHYDPVFMNDQCMCEHFPVFPTYMQTPKQKITCPKGKKSKHNDKPLLDL